MAKKAAPKKKPAAKKKAPSKLKKGGAGAGTLKPRRHL